MENQFSDTSHNFDVPGAFWTQKMVLSSKFYELPHNKNLRAYDHGPGKNQSRKIQTYLSSVQFPGKQGFHYVPLPNAPAPPDVLRGLFVEEPHHQCKHQWGRQQPAQHHTRSSACDKCQCKSVTLDNSNAPNTNRFKSLAKVDLTVRRPITGTVNCRTGIIHLR